MDGRQQLWAGTPEPERIPLGVLSADREVLWDTGSSSGGAIRVGATVHRRPSPRAPLVHLFLEHLSRAGFDLAPRFLGTDVTGREVLTYLEGDVAVPPFPAWSADEGLMVSVAELQRDLHAAAVGFEIPPRLSPLVRHPPGLLRDLAGDLMCHQDLCVANVVVRERRAVGAIDFDLASPCDRLLDIAIAARHWVPLREPADLEDGFTALETTDLLRRFARFCDVHDLDRASRRRVVAAARRFLEAALPVVRGRATAEEPGAVAVWRDGYEEQNLRSQRWLSRHGSQLVAAHS